MSSRFRQTVISWQGLSLLAVAGMFVAAAIIRNINLLLLLAGMLVGSVWVNWRMVRRILGQVHVRRFPVAGVSAGEPFILEWEVRNDSRRSAWGLFVKDRLIRVGDKDAKPLVAQSLFPRVLPRTAVRQNCQITLYERGRYRLSKLSVSCRFPFGLVSQTRPDPSTAEVLVYPRIGILRQALVPRRQEGIPLRTVAKRRQHRMEGDFHSMREWRTGDSRRWIHWRTTARTGKLMVRQFERQQQHDLVIMLDFWQPQDANHTALENVELAASLAASVLVDECDRVGGHVVLVIAGKEMAPVHGPSSPRLLQQALERLAMAEATPNPEWQAAVDQAKELAVPGCEWLVISTREFDPAVRLFPQAEGNGAKPAGDRQEVPILDHLRVVDVSQDEVFEVFDGSVTPTPRDKGRAGAP